MAAAAELGPWTACCCCCAWLPPLLAAAAAAAMLVAAIRSDMLDPTPEDTPDVECLPVPAEAWKKRRRDYSNIKLILSLGFAHFSGGRCMTESLVTYDMSHNIRSFLLSKGLLYKNRFSPKTNSLLTNRSSLKTYSQIKDLLADRESIFGEDLFLYSSPRLLRKKYCTYDIPIIPGKTPSTRVSHVSSCARTAAHPD